MRLIYIAGPLFNTHERRYLEQVAEAVEKRGYATFLPHRDAGLLSELTMQSRERLFKADVEALSKCDACVALLTGPDHDSGTSAELGYMYALGKACFGITDDIRWLNNMIWGICGQGSRIAPSIEQLAELVARELG
ncbi:MAG: nucleoside 2-deoxyribosyltransferase [Chloroflexota bacterium]|nr:nucleoside 2-deoxyribosyltransferase [Chloroflexota bacterium]